MKTNFSLFALFALLLTARSVLSTPLDFSRYHTQPEINAYLRSVAADYPALARFEKLGDSDQGREINYVILTRAVPGAAKVIYLNGTHHGNEKSSTETALGVLDHLIANQNAPEIQALLDRYAIAIQPLVNPDGHSANTRADAFGRDPNRDYSYPGKEDADAFKTKGIGLVRSFMERHRVFAAVAYHSGMEGVLWPWCAKKAPTDVQDKFYTISRAAADAMGMPYVTQSYLDYPSNGEFIDYAFLRQQTWGVTVEVSQAGNPAASQLDGVVKRGVRGTMAFIHAVTALDQGTLAVQSVPRRLPGLNPLFAMLGEKLE